MGQVFPKFCPWFSPFDSPWSDHGFIFDDLLLVGGSTDLSAPAILGPHLQEPAGQVCVEASTMPKLNTTSIVRCSYESWESHAGGHTSGSGPGNKAALVAGSSPRLTSIRPAATPQEAALLPRPWPLSHLLSLLTCSFETTLTGCELLTSVGPGGLRRPPGGHSGGEILHPSGNHPSSGECSVLRAHRKIRRDLPGGMKRKATLSVPPDMLIELLLWTRDYIRGLGYDGETDQILLLRNPQFNREPGSGQVI